jgi:hypothetical protein
MTSELARQLLQESEPAKVLNPTIISLFLPYRINSNEQLILTKGDNNDADDLGLYNGPRWMRRRNIVGKVRG